MSACYLDPIFGFEADVDTGKSFSTIFFMRTG